jgi:hypothetical protein
MHFLNKKYFFRAILMLGFLLIGVSVSSAATSDRELSHMSLEEQKLYYLTHESCQLFMKDPSIKSGIITVLNPQAIDVMFGTVGDINHMMGKYFQGDEQAFDRLLNNRYLGTYVRTLLNSDGFTLALRDCFPNEEVKRNAYVLNLLVLDGAAKYVMIAGTAVGYLKFLKWTHAYFNLPWVKALFFGHTAMLLTSSSSATNRSFSQMMADQYKNLSSQIDALLKSEEQKNKDNIW